MHFKYILDKRVRDTLDRRKDVFKIVQKGNSRGMNKLDGRTSWISIYSGPLLIGHVIHYVIVTSHLFLANHSFKLGLIFSIKNDDRELGNEPREDPYYTSLIVGPGLHLIALKWTKSKKKKRSSSWPGL